MSSISVAGDVSGAISIAAPSVAGSGTLTLPVATDTLVGKATTDTLTNKSIAATQLTGTIAAAVLPAGSVLQVVSSNYSTQVTNATSTYADTGLTATITPSSASSKILIIINQADVSKINNTSCSIRLLRGATVIYTPALLAAFTITATVNTVSVGGNYLDSPATTSATTYKTQFASQANIAEAVVQRNGASSSSITLMEIQG